MWIQLLSLQKSRIFSNFIWTACNPSRVAAMNLLQSERSEFGRQINALILVAKMGRERLAHGYVMDIWIRRSSSAMMGQPSSSHGGKGVE